MKKDTKPSDLGPIHINTATDTLPKRDAEAYKKAVELGRILIEQNRRLIEEYERKTGRPAPAY